MADTDQEGGDVRGEVCQDEERDSSKREYLKSIGFARDPFGLPVSNQEYAFSNELAFNGQRSELFSPLSYYVKPRAARRQRPVALEELAARRHTFVLGERGAGKTTLRLATESFVRGRPERTLVVSYLLSGQTAAPTGGAAHLERLAGQLTTDLFIQLVERFRPLGPPPDVAATERLGALLGCYQASWLRRLRQALAEAEPSLVWGHAKLWRRVGRPVVRAVAGSAQLQAWLDQLVDAFETDYMTLLKQASPEARWQFALETARLWRFEAVLITVDGVDTLERDVAAMSALIDPLLAALPEFDRQEVYLKCFLPLELQAYARERLAAVRAAAGALLRIDVIRLRWDDRGLREMLAARFLAAGSRRARLSELAERDLRDSIDDELLAAAQGSPRRMLQLVDRLIETHASAALRQPSITAAEWRTARREQQGVWQEEGRIRL